MFSCHRQPTFLLIKKNARNKSGLSVAPKLQGPYAPLLRRSPAQFKVIQKAGRKRPG